jgi:DNA-binding NarL/FixJ family response regulator/tRNA A-37 threonylcarbamoyl transferase component Bud32
MIGLKLNGRYEVLEHLGEGATATVYKGLDTLLGREVALKILLPHVRDTTRKRFFQEAMAAARLNHPNIMAIHDRGDDNGRHYLVVEYVEGDSLTSYIPSAPDVVVSLGAQIGRALEYAHERDIIHRDIKPANIKVTPEGQVKIMDLGLARPRDGKRVTAPGMVIGTPAYISPEQAQGLELDRRTDLYSLGIVLYEMATGQLPFNADDITALMLQHVQQPPPPPRLLVPSLPVALERVILKSLEKQAARRFQTGRTMADALEACLANITPEAQRSATQPRRPEWAKTLQTDRLKEPQARRTAATGKPTIRIVMADDHTLLRRTLASYLEQQDDFVILAEAGDGDSALAQTLALMPDVLILDLNMPGKGGLDILPDLRAKAPNVKVLVLTGREDDHYILRALRTGAHGYVLKSTDEMKLVESIRKVVDDEMVLGRGIAEKVVGGLLGAQHDSQLTDVERKIVLHIARGYENDEISHNLNLGMTEMIETMARIMDKMNVRDRNAAALKALRSGIITLEDLHDLPPPPHEQ